MRPQRNAAENDMPDGWDDPVLAASMRPQRYAAENKVGIFPWGVHIRCFNEAAA